jgi:hypothetical protein
MSMVSLGGLVEKLTKLLLINNRVAVNLMLKLRGAGLRPAGLPASRLGSKCQNVRASRAATHHLFAGKVTYLKIICKRKKLL